MGHTFLLEPGRWKLEGTLMDRKLEPTLVKGRTLVTWTTDGWFTMATKLTFPESNLPEQTLTYKGRLDPDEQRFSFILQHSAMGKIEGEGWVAPESIIQRYWVMDDKQLRSGFQTAYKQGDDCYYLCSAVVAGSTLISNMEAVLTRSEP
jgi:hypothetical protein